MALGEFRPPNQIDKDEDKYGKGQLSFTKIQILYAALGLLLGFLVFSILSAFHVAFLNLVGAVFMVCMVLLGVILGGFTIPAKNYLSGGGLRLDMYFRRKLTKKFSKKKKIIYTNNINRDKDVTYTHSLDASNSVLNTLVKKIIGEEGEE